MICVIGTLPDRASPASPPAPAASIQRLIDDLRCDSMPWNAASKSETISLWILLVSSSAPQITLHFEVK
jgi:hypothetical protein